MKTCLTCGASVADDADVCPDCGMEFDAGMAPAAVVQPAPANDEGAGFTVDFGDESTDSSLSSASQSGASEADLDEPDFDFAPPEPKVVLEKSAPEPEAAPAVAVDNLADTAKITLRRGGALTSESFTFGGGAIVGRFDPDSGPVDVDLAPLPEASYVSRHHAEFRHDAGQNKWFVRDMGSSNGTFWRAGGAGAFSRLAGEQELNAGDEISLGNARFEFGVG